MPVKENILGKEIWNLGSYSWSETSLEQSLEIFLSS